MSPARRVLALATLAASLVAAHACARLAGGPGPSLAEVMRAYEREVTPYHPFTASERGLRQYDRVLANDIGEEYRSGHAALCTRHREALRRVDPARLGEQDRLTHDILAHHLDTCLARLRLPWHLLPVDQVGFTWPSRFPIVGAGRGQHRFRTVRNYEDFLGRIDGFVVWMDQAIANMRAGLARGITHPRDAMLRVVPQLDAQIVDDPEASLFWEPIRNFPASFDEAARRALAERYRRTIAERIVPAYRRLRAFLQDEYLPRCRTSWGLGDLPGGREMYAWAVRVSTTTDLTVDQIHALGLEEVRRIRAELERLRVELEASPEPEPVQHRTVTDLLEGYAEVRAQVEAALPRLFGRFPRAGYEIRAIEPFRERSMPSAYAAAAPDGSRPGVFYLNAAAVRAGGTLPVFRSLFLHEAVPGHHFQIALQREHPALPGFRRFGWYTAFGEGWALYAEGLGEELGVYRGRRDRASMLFSDLFRARRLVVDTGLHAKGWTRARAIDYLGGRRENAEREVDRYTVWPGQALGYKIGQLRFQAIRRKAEAALGAAFDVRTFHDELLKDGAMPLSILEAKMDRWIAARRGQSS
jgi:uncharacterized protein (DUF885 family)